MSKPKKPKKKKSKKDEDNNTGALLPVGVGGPGIDWDKLSKDLEKKK